MMQMIQISVLFSLKVDSHLRPSGATALHVLDVSLHQNSHFNSYLESDSDMLFLHWRYKKLQYQN